MTLTLLTVCYALAGMFTIGLVVLAVAAWRTDLRVTAAAFILGALWILDKIVTGALMLIYT